MTVCRSLCFAGLFFCSLRADCRPVDAETPLEKEARLAWWTNDRFGMFIHFGLYSMGARGEWVKGSECISDFEYDSYFKNFNPNLLDAKSWAHAAKAAGMKYVVLTAKHHEGFCLWDSKFTEYKITKTPYGKDLLREFVEAVRGEGLKVGLYYSLIDWNHPDFTIDVIHPKHPKDDEEWNDPNAYVDLNKGRDMSVYRKYMKDQLRELLTGYGRIDILWFDYSYPWAKTGKGRDDWDSRGLLEIVREIQPWVIVDNRLDLKTTDWGWDFVTPEQFKVAEWPRVKGAHAPWETCQTFSGHWGYARDEMTWKSTSQILELLANTVSKGGNLILNVGPTARGEFDDRALSRLRDIGKWMRTNGEAIYGCTQAPDGLIPPEYSLLTYNPQSKKLYVHLVFYPMGSLACPFGDKVLWARFLHDGSEIKLKQHKKYFTNGYQGLARFNFDLPVVKPPVEMPVIEVMLREAPLNFNIVTYNVRHGQGNGTNCLDLARQMSLIQDVCPRFVLLQEVDRYAKRSNFIDEIEVYGKLMGMCPTFGKTVKKGAWEYGLGVLSREKPISTEQIIIPDTTETRMVLICEFADCYVANTHLSVASEADRETALGKIRERIAKGLGKPLFLGGDFNSLPGSKILKEIQKDFVLLTPTNQTTYIGKAFPDPHCIDYIAIDKGHAEFIKAEGSVLGPVAMSAPSDHRPVVLSVEIKEK